MYAATGRLFPQGMRPRGGQVSDQPRSPREVRGRPGETLHRAWGQGPARFLASLGHPGMYGVTGRQYLQDMGPMTGQVTGRPRSPGDVRGDWSILSTRHRGQGAVRFLASLGRPGKHGGDRVRPCTKHGSNDRPGFWPASVTRRCTVRLYSTVARIPPGMIRDSRSVGQYSCVLAGLCQMLAILQAVVRVLLVLK